MARGYLLGHAIDKRVMTKIWRHVTVLGGTESSHLRGAHLRMHVTSSWGAWKQLWDALAESNLIGLGSGHGRVLLSLNQNNE